MNRVKVEDDNLSHHRRSPTFASSAQSAESEFEHEELPLRPQSAQNHSNTVKLPKKKKYKTSSTTCDICSRSFSSLHSLGRHKNIHLDIRPFFCKSCKSRFAEKWSMTAHKCLQYRCDTCERRFVDTKSLANHQRMHNGPWNCQAKNCKVKPFTKTQALVDHYMNHHTEKDEKNEKPWKCVLEGCSIRCRDSTTMKRHLGSRAHGNYHRPHPCKFCRRSFPARYMLRDHVKKKHGKRTGGWICCGQIFKLKRFFTRHCRFLCPDQGENFERVSEFPGEHSVKSEKPVKPVKVKKVKTEPVSVKTESISVKIETSIAAAEAAEQDADSPSTTSAEADIPTTPKSRGTKRKSGATPQIKTESKRRKAETKAVSVKEEKDCCEDRSPISSEEPPHFIGSLHPVQHSKIFDKDENMKNFKRSSEKSPMLDLDNTPPTPQPLILEEFAEFPFSTGGWSSCNTGKWMPIPLRNSDVSLQCQVCPDCGEFGRVKYELILCSTCLSGYHFRCIQKKCIDPPGNPKALREWKCHGCTNNRTPLVSVLRLGFLDHGYN